jgi:hypothetical protein
MTNQETSIEWLFNLTNEGYWDSLDAESKHKALKLAMDKQQEQAQSYARFVVECLNNNLPPIVFNDWVINIRR